MDNKEKVFKEMVNVAEAAKVMSSCLFDVKILLGKRLIGDKEKIILSDAKIEVTLSTVARLLGAEDEA